MNIFKSYELVEQEEVCKEYLWQVNKTLLKQSGEYTHPLKTIQGCDSIIKLNLIVNHDFEKADTVLTDSAYTWFVNHQTYPISGIYQEHFISSTGCDSIHVLFRPLKGRGEFTIPRYPALVDPMVGLRYLIMVIQFHQ
ncbi:MAG: hypothetical protein IPL31_04525 [Saprospiraceae bacterium]|nr:hypothetical protein [Saprospiraceae bacterium]